MTTRKLFLQNTAILVAGAMTSWAFDFSKKKPMLSFSTLGCPDWSFEKITDFAAEHGYQGIEVRGILRQLDLLQCPQFNTASSRKTTIRILKDKGLRLAGLGSSATLHFAARAERQKNLDEGKQYIDLAEQTGCPYVRVFPNNFPKDQGRDQTIDLISRGLLELARHAEGSAVTVLMETHGDLVKADDLLTVMGAAAHKNAGLVWDISNMWTITKEPPAEVFGKLNQYIRHTHFKDAKIIEGKPQYTLLGEGEVPVFAAIDELIRHDYQGYYSFEWEKLWHPGIAEPEVALAHYPGVMRQYFNK